MKLLVCLHPAVATTPQEAAVQIRMATKDIRTCDATVIDAWDQGPRDYANVFVAREPLGKLVPLTEIHDSDWLAQYRLADLYFAGDFFAGETP